MIVIERIQTEKKLKHKIINLMRSKGFPSMKSPQARKQKIIIKKSTQSQLKAHNI